MLALALRPLNACVSLFIVTDAHDSNYHVGNINKIPHVNDFTYLQYFYCCQKHFKPTDCLFECILVAPASSVLVERVLSLSVS